MFSIRLIQISIVLLCFSVKASAQQSDYSDVSTDSLIDLSFQLSSQHLDSSLLSSNALVERFEKDNDTLAGIYGYNLLGFIYYYKDDYLEGIRAHRKSNAIISQTKNYQYLKVENHVGLSSLYSLMGNYSSAVDQLLKAQECITEEHEAYDQSLVYQTMAEVFYDIGDYKTSLKYARKVNAYLEEEFSEGLNSVSPVNSLIADIYARRGKLDSAEILATTDLEISRSDKHIIGEIYALEVLAAVNYYRGNLDSAISLQTLAYSYAKEFDDQFTLALEAADLGLYHLMANQLDLSGQYAHEALEITDKFPPNLARKEALELGHKLAEANSEYSKALEYFKELSTINQQMAGANISEEIVKSRYLISEKERNLLTLKSELQEKQIEAQNKFNILISTITLLLAIAVVAVFLAFRNSRKFNRKLRHKQKILNNQRLELRELNEELETNGKNKDKLLSILSHDVRQPFHQTISLLEILEHSDMPEPGMNEMVRSIKQSVRDHKSSIDNLLTWSKSQLNGINRQPANVDIPELVDEVSIALTSSLKEKELKLIKKIAPNTVAFADPDQLEIILKNLLGNAIKFSYPKTEVTISACTEANHTIIKIADHGVGMDQNSQQSLLDRKQQFSKRGTLDESGSGFGTLIVLDFVAQNKGKLELRSELGEGTEFTIDLPANLSIHNAPLPVEEAQV